MTSNGFDDPYTRDLEYYLVGGAVRDELMGRAVKDRDFVVVGASPGEMQRRGFRPVGRGFPVFLHPRTHEEYALARTERKSGPGYRGFDVWFDPGVTLEQDLARRDLTINAMAKTSDGRIIDPHGGQDDLAAGVLRHVSAAFSEDPLRVLRVARFLARFGQHNFVIADETIELMKAVVAAGEMEALTAERVWQELNSALGEMRPDMFVLALRQCGALARLLPEVDRLFGIPQTEKYHPEVDTGMHVLLVLQVISRLKRDPLLAYAALLHDLGKGLTPKEALPRHVQHEQRGVEAVRQVCERLRAPKAYRELAVAVCRYHLIMHRLPELKAKSVLKLLQNLDGFRRPERVRQFALVCEADSRGRGGRLDASYPSATLLLDYHEKARNVDLGDLRDLYSDPGDIAEEVRRRRIAAIQSVRRSTP